MVGWRGGVLDLAHSTRRQMMASLASAWPLLGQRTNGVLDRLNVVPNSPALIKSIGDASELLSRRRPQKDLASWTRRREVVERALRRSIGLERLPERTPLRSRSVGRTEREGYAIENVVFESRAGFPVSCNLYRPAPSAGGKRAAVLVPLGHYILEGKTASEVQALADGLARLGMVVLVYDAIGHGERMIPGNVHHEAGYALMPVGETIAGWMVWDSMRAIDYLETLPEVDASRIGVTGNSGGGLNTLLTAALDRRVRTAVVAGFSFTFNHWIKYAGAHCACTHWPGIFQEMEWFEAASLIAPRPLLLLHGEHDEVFPIAGARQAASLSEATYSLYGEPGRIRFDEIAGQPHAYSRALRERAYGWLARHLQGRGEGAPMAERPVELMAEEDPRLLCGAAAMGRQPSVVDLARQKAELLVSRLGGPRPIPQAWLEQLTGSEIRPGFLAPATVKKTLRAGTTVEEINFVSEDGVILTGSLWLAGQRPARIAIVVDDKGRAAAAQPELVAGLAAAGFAVLAVDLRGRGEALGHFRREWDTNYRLVACQVMSGNPLAGLRAFDIRRSLDYVSLRSEISTENAVVVGFGEDVLPVLLAAAADRRIRNVAVSGWVCSVVSQIRGMAVGTDRRELRRVWNSAQLHGRINAGRYEVDFGSVIPRVLETAEVAEIVCSIAPRRVLFRDARDRGAGAERLRQLAGPWLDFRPEERLDASTLLGWLRESDGSRTRA